MDPQDGSNQDLEGVGSSDQLFLHPPYTLPTDNYIQLPEGGDPGVVEMDSRVPPPADPSMSPYTSPITVPSGYTTWATSSMTPQQSRGTPCIPQPAYDKQGQPIMVNDTPTMDNRDQLRPQRPSGPARTPSNTYAPQRRPPQQPFPSHPPLQRTNSGRRTARRDPNAQYRAQEKAYVQRVRQDTGNWFGVESHVTGSSFGGTDSELEDESPSTESHFEGDFYDPDTQIFIGENNGLPTFEEMNVPRNRERLEWHSMLASVLKGDVVRQEKQRLIGTLEQKGHDALNNEIWIGVRARTCGRTNQVQKKIIEDGRNGIGPLIEAIISFQIKGETEVGKTPVLQVQDIVEKIEKCESLYSTRKELESANSRASSEAFQASCDAVIAWHNTTLLINTELAILQGWVGNDELDFTKPRVKSPRGAELSDDGSFLDRVMKEDGLKTLQGEHSMLSGIGEVIKKAKSTLIDNAEAFAQRHLPPYIEELLTLINFPSRLIQEIIRVRLSYAKKMKDPSQQSPILVDQMIGQFRILMKVAVEIKQRYLVISEPEPGWDLPPCVDENFDAVVVDALKYYFRLLGWKLGANTNTFKEAEILEQEWGFSNEIGRQLEGGDIEVAEQFSTLTARLLQRLVTHFGRELARKDGEDPAEMEKRYKQGFDSARVRQRKLFRFSRLLRQCFENATEYNLKDDILPEFYEALLISGHFLVTCNASVGQKGVCLIASPSLFNRPKDIQSILGTSFRADDGPEDPSNPYILVMRPEKSFSWSGGRMDVDLLEQPTDIRPGKLRLVADGSQQRLQNARLALTQLTGLQHDVTVEQRANLGRVNVELNKIKKTAYKLSTAIVDSVEFLRRQEGSRDNHELIQTCFAFATEFGKRSLMYMDPSRRSMNNAKLVKLAMDWVSFICDDCDPADRRTFKWAVAALEFAMIMTHGNNVLTVDDADFSELRTKVAGCMSLLISHFDIMGARSTLAAQAEKQRIAASGGGMRKLDSSRVLDDAEATRIVREQRMCRLAAIEELRVEEEAKRQALGRVLEGANEADRSLTVLSSSATNVTLRWQQGQFVGGGTFGAVYAAIDLDTSYLMAVKEIRLQDPQNIPRIAQQIRDEMGVLEVLDHPNIVSYHGIEVHRDKVYMFMEYCSGGSLAGLLEHGRIEDETVIMVYALQMLEGLAYLHQAGIVHRDIKPENILLDHNGVIKYVDFGAAKIIARQGQTLMQTNPFAAATKKQGGGGGGTTPNKDAAPAAGRKAQKTMTGTPMYMSPEVIRGDSASSGSPGRHGSVDIWSLGCVILEMATGRRPWSTLDNEWAIMYNIAQGNQPEMPTSDQLSEVGIDFLKLCFERDALKRPSAAELLQHEWIVSIRQQVVVEPQTPTSEGTGSMSGSSAVSRQNSNY
ncbi:Suppressor of Sensor Kinase (SLN1) [Arachnomyces sp. PD_36]|nr:Suppressor of Sensor Kinase (SLN1) [Arachnomyces sp. PD_36]